MVACAVETKDAGADLPLLQSPVERSKLPHKQIWNKGGVLRSLNIKARAAPLTAIYQEAYGVESSDCF